HTAFGATQLAIELHFTGNKPRKWVKKIGSIQPSRQREIPAVSLEACSRVLSPKGQSGLGVDVGNRIRLIRGGKILEWVVVHVARRHGVATTDDKATGVIRVHFARRAIHDMAKELGVH